MDYTKYVNYYETDKMGIVHHSNYIRWFEEARIYMLDKAGLNYDKVEKAGILIPVLECSCRYIKSALFNMTVAIETEISFFNGIKMELSYKVKDSENGQLLATGSTKHCFLSKDFKPLRLKKEFPDFYEKLLKIYENSSSQN